MTMRLDIVTNDAGELVRREHARELGAGVVVALYRLAKLAQMHDLANLAFLRQLEQTGELIAEYTLRAGAALKVLFAHKATFVAGQLLKGNRGAYEAAAELGALFERLGGAELHVARDVTREDLLAFAEAVSALHRTGNAGQARMPARIQVRAVTDAARLRGIDLEDLTPDQRIVRAYASAVVVMRRFFEDLAASRYVLPRRIKRVAQSLVDLSDVKTASFLGVTEVRNANHDDAGRAVNTAILAVAIAREVTSHRPTLAQVAMAAMMHDVARPRALALAGAAEPSMPGMAGPSTLSEDQEDRLAAGAAAVLTALGRVNEPSIARTVLAFEALWLRRRTWLGPVYWGARPPTLHATIITVARRYNDLLTPEPGLEPPTTDYAVATLASELTEVQDRTVLRMLVSALGLLPTGTTVQLSTGEVADVIRGAQRVGDKPRLRLLRTATGAPFEENVELELARDPSRVIQRVLSVDGWRRGLEQPPAPEPDAEASSELPAPPPASGERWSRPPGVAPSPSGPSWSVSGARARAPSGAPPPSSGGRARPPSSPSWTSSLPSMGFPPPSSPPEQRSASGPPIAAPDADRTVFQPHGPPGVARRRAPAVAAPSRAPTARGKLASSPVPHVLVYMLDRELSGSVVFGASSDADTVAFASGVPVKARISAPAPLLGELLVEGGHLDGPAVHAALEGAHRLGVLLGEFLVGHEIVTRGALAEALEAQLLVKMAHLANLSPETEYAYYRDVDRLDGWGGECAVSHPLNPILASVRGFADRARLRAAVDRIGKHQLALHPGVSFDALATEGAEGAVIEALRERPMTLDELFGAELAPEGAIVSLVYVLAVTRHLAFSGKMKPPMGPAARDPAGVAGPAPGSARPRSTPARRAPARSAPPPSPSAPPRSERARPAPAAVPLVRPVARPPHGPPRLDEDDVKTVAIASPRLPRVVRREATPLPLPSAPPPPSARPRLSAPPPPSAPPPSARPPLSVPPPSAPVSGEDGFGVADSEAIAALEAMASFRLAESALQRDDVAAAEVYAAKAVAADPSEWDYVALLAWTRALRGDGALVDEAIRTLSKVLIEDPSNVRALYYRGKLLVRTNRLPEALIDFTELLSADPHHRDAQSEAQRLKAKLAEA